MYSYLTVHLAHLRAEESDVITSAPATASAWRTGVDSPVGENGFRTGRSKIWGGIGFYDSQELALAALNSDAETLPFTSIADEVWHGAMAVTAHRGEVDLSLADEPHPALRAVETDPGGPLAIITSAGYTDYSDADHDRHRQFLRGVEAVREHYASLPNNKVRQVINPLKAPDGCTFSIWQDLPGMMAAAYKNGTHSEMLSAHRDSALFDRSSFTRLRILHSRGTWNGSNPAHEAA